MWCHLWAAAVCHWPSAAALWLLAEVTPPSSWHLSRPLPFAQSAAPLCCTYPWAQIPGPNTHTHTHIHIFILIIKTLTFKTDIILRCVSVLDCLSKGDRRTDLLDLLCDFFNAYCILIGLCHALGDVHSFVSQQHHILLQLLQPLGGII